MLEPEGDRQPTILVVDDDVLLRLGATDHLRDHGFVAVEAASGDEAKAVLEAGVSVDLIFSDINMPGDTDGVALAQWAAANLPDVPVVLTSGVQSALTAAQAACPQAKEFLIKPYDYDVLVQRLRTLTALRAKHT
jgi:DNA-binding NtrC family response regulator